MSWNVVPGAISYKIYRSTNPDSSFTLYDTSGANTYTDIGVILTGTNYYYYVTAINSTVRNTNRTIDLKE